MTHNIYIYILIMGGISYLIRVLPMTLIRKPLKNQFLQSFLYYVGVVAAWCGAGLLPVAVLCCAVVFIAELFL